MKKNIALVLALVMLLALTACGAPAAKTEQPAPAESAAPAETNETQETTAEAVKTEMSFGNTQPDTDVESLQLYACQKSIEDATDGNFSVEVFTNSALGDTDDILEQAIQGAAVLTVTDPGRLADYIPEYGILQMPYIMEDYTKIDPITSTEMVSNWEKGFEDFGVKVLTSNWYGGARQFVCNKEINEPADLNGLKIRTMGSDLCIKSITAMGAVGTAMPQSQIYSGIEQKALDGCENQSTSTYASRLYEICKYINKTGHFILLGCPATGTTYFNSLPADYQQLLVDTFKANGTEYQSICAEMELKCEQDMADNYGVTIHEVDTAKFKEAVQPVYTELGYDELRNTILEEAGLN